MNHILTGNFTSIEQATGRISRNATGTVNTNDALGAVSFGQILNEQQSKNKAASCTESTAGIKFSKHAGERLEQRDIQLTDEQLERLEKGTQKACSKGIKESLVLLDNMAFIVNTKNNTVVTAMDQDMNEDNIYTNIDGAVIV
jgi:flagellar operon protein